MSPYVQPFQSLNDQNSPIPLLARSVAQSASCVTVYACWRWSKKKTIHSRQKRVRRCRDFRIRGCMLGTKEHRYRNKTENNYDGSKAGWSGVKLCSRYWIWIFANTVAFDSSLANIAAKGSVVSFFNQYSTIVIGIVINVFLVCVLPVLLPQSHKLHCHWRWRWHTERKQESDETIN